MRKTSIENPFPTFIHFTEKETGEDISVSIFSITNCQPQGTNTKVTVRGHTEYIVEESLENILNRVLEFLNQFDDDR